MKILLISPNTLTVPYPVYPIGLDYVAGAIGPEHEVRIFDLLAQTMDELRAIIDSFVPDVIGISIRNIDNTDVSDSTYFLEDHRALISWLRQHTSAILVCGGSGFTIMPEPIMTLLDLDYGIVGEGERFALLLEALARAESPGNIPGVITSEKLRKNDHGMSPPPVWTGKPPRQFAPAAAHVPFYLKNGGMLNLQTKRGCTFRCIYCPYPHIEGRSHRCIPPDEVAATAIQLQEAGARYLFFTDSAFNSDALHSVEVARALKKIGLTIPWGAFFAPTPLPEDYFATMAAGGCSHVEFGTESMCDAMLATYRKPFRAKDIFVAHRQARQAGLRVAHYFLLGGPGESAATLHDCFNGIEQLERAVFFLFTGIRIYPGTHLYEIAMAEGKITEQMDLLQPLFYQPDEIDLASIEALANDRADCRSNWITGSGGKACAGTVQNLHSRGMTGPLWEYLAR